MPACLLFADGMRCERADDVEACFGAIGRVRMQLTPKDWRAPGSAALLCALSGT